MVTRTDIYDVATEYLTYDGEYVRWKKKIKKSKYYPGDIAGTVDAAGYVRVALFRRAVAAHRFAWESIHGPIPDCMQVDHINHIRSDNRIENLRLVTHHENSQNVKLPKNNTSGVIGVSYNKNRGTWQASIGGRLKGTHEHLGCFHNIEDAIRARRSAEKRLGYHENHGKTHEEI